MRLDEPEALIGEGEAIEVDAHRLCALFNRSLNLRHERGVCLCLLDRGVNQCRLDEESFSHFLFLSIGGS
jgi:hypothetical protein